MPGTTVPTPKDNDLILLLIYAWCALGPFPMDVELWGWLGWNRRSLFSS